MAKEKTLEELIQWVDGFEYATRDARFLAERDRDYYDNRQWTEEEVAELKRRRQPILTINRIAPKIDFMLGYERRSRNDPKAYPRTPMKDEGGANAATDAIRYVCDVAEWPQERSRAFEYFIAEGVCGAYVGVDRKNNDDIDITIEHTPWDRLIWDYRSRRRDFQDAKWLGQISWFDLEDALEIFKGYKGAEEILEDSVSRQFGTNLDDTFDDKPRYFIWTDTKSERPRVKIGQIFYRIGGPNSPWYLTLFTRAGFIAEPRLSPFLDANDVPSCPLILQACKTDRDNQRYGVIRQLISPQDEINHRRSKALHLLNVRQALIERDSVEDINRTKLELSKPDGTIVVNPGARFEILPTTDMLTGQLNLLQEAKLEIDALGANAALAGRDTNAISGRAIQAKQQGGQIELEPVYDGFRAWQLRVYRAIWERVRQFWTAEKWIRVTDNENNLRYVGLNKPVTVGELMQRQGMQLPDMSGLPPMVQEQIQQQLSQVVDTENDIAELDVDIIIDEAVDVVTLQQEQFATLAQIPNMPPDLLIEASSLRNKEEILERLRNGGATPEQQQAAAQQQQAMQQLAMQNAGLDLQQKQVNIGKTVAQTEEIGEKIEKSQHDSAIDYAKLRQDGAAKLLDNELKSIKRE